MQTMAYKVKEFSLENLQGISNKTLETHFKLYKDYVIHTNELNEKIFSFLERKNITKNQLTDYSELKRRFGFEYNGMILHELYFGNLQKDGEGAPAKESSFLKNVENSFGDFKTWKLDFVSTGKMRGVGWTICYQDPTHGTLSNHWISLHEISAVTAFNPILVMDVWEHAFLLDYAPSERSQYIEAFFSNINWNAVEGRLTSKPNKKE